MAVSSNTLFHFTNSFERICGILTNGFQISYCLESKLINKELSIGAIPIISFCDLPLSQIINHINDYGNYAIGMTMNWGRENNLNPVIYFERNSHITRDFFTAFVKLSELVFENDISESNNKIDYKEIISFIGNIDRFSKNYMGELKRNGKVINKYYKFYNEREWRYIPEFNTKNLKPRLSLKEYNKFKSENPNKPHFPNIRLNFTPHEIKYLIVNTESEIPLLVNFILSKLKLGTLDDRQILSTRIFTSDQIREDI